MREREERLRLSDCVKDWEVMCIYRFFNKEKRVLGASQKIKTKALTLLSYLIKSHLICFKYFKKNNKYTTY